MQVPLYDADIATLLEQVQAGQLDLALGIFGPVAGIRRTPFFRFSPMVIRPEAQAASSAAPMTWA